MTLKSVMVHVDETPAALIRAEIAVALASWHGAAIEGLIVSSPPAVPYGMGAMAFETTFNSMRAQIMQQTREAADGAAAKVKAACGLDAHIFDVSLDRLVIDVASRMRPFDVVVLGPPRENGLSIDGDMFEAAVFTGGRPVIVVPPDRNSAPVGKSVAIAWKDSRETARAIHDAMPILEQADAVRLVAVHSGADTKYYGRPALDRMEMALRARGIRMELAIVKAAEDDISEEVLDAARGAGADLLVMGAYGRMRFTEILFGGVTRHALTASDTALFMSH